MNERLVGILGSPVIQALIVIGMLLLYLRFVWEYRRALRRRFEDPEWKAHNRRLLVWKWKMWSFLAAGALVLLVVALDLLGGTSSGTTTMFKWAFGFLFVWAGATAFIEGYMEGPGGPSNHA